MSESTTNHRKETEQWPAVIVLGGAGAAMAAVHYDSHFYIRLLLLLTFIRALYNRLATSNYRFLRGAPWALLLTLLALTVYLTMTPKFGRVLLNYIRGEPVHVESAIDGVISLVAVVVSALFLGGGWHALGVPWSLLGILAMTTVTSLMAFVIETSTPEKWPEGKPFPIPGVPIPGQA